MAGRIRIDEEEVSPGKIIHVTLQSPEERQFIQQIRIYKDVPAADVAAGVLPQAYYIGGVSISFEQNSVETGEPFEVEVDSLNFTPGTYFFLMIVPFSDAFIYDKVRVVEGDELALSWVRRDMVRHNRKFEIYSYSGDLLDTDREGKIPPVAMKMDTIYTLAINLKYFEAFQNKIRVDLYDPSGLELQYENLMEIKVIREVELDGQVVLTGKCSGTSVSYKAYGQGIVLVHFRTPAKQKYYEYDGELAFIFSAVEADSGHCTFKENERRYFIDDTPAHPYIPNFAAYNEREYPGQPWRNDYPFDTIRLRFARYGTLGMNTHQEIVRFTELAESIFLTATKGFFRLEVEGTNLVPYVNNANREKVAEWYRQVPKTPNKPMLDLERPEELELAVMLYYEERTDDGEEITRDMLAIYPPGLHKEDLTAYIYDGNGGSRNPLGRAMGEIGCRLQAARLHPAEVFYEGTGANRTYHFDLSVCQSCGNTVEEYRTYLSEEYNGMRMLGVLIHELGHIAWLGRAGVTNGDLSERYLPFRSDFVQIDRSIGYYTRYEFMSYGRSNSSLQDVSYGDAFLEKLLEAYSRPEVEIEFISHPNRGNNTITVNAGDRIIFDLVGKAKSGLATLWYRVEQSPVRLAYNTPERFGYRYYDEDRPRMRLDSMRVTLNLTKAGEYVYCMRSKDLLHPIKWQHHESALGKFTIIVM